MAADPHSTTEKLAEAIYQKAKRDLPPEPVDLFSEDKPLCLRPTTQGRQCRNKVMLLPGGVRASGCWHHCAEEEKPLRQERKAEEGAYLDAFSSAVAAYTEKLERYLESL